MFSKINMGDSTGVSPPFAAPTVTQAESESFSPIFYRVCTRGFGFSDAICSTRFATKGFVNTDNINDNDNTHFQLQRANNIATIRVGEKSFVFVTGGDDDGVSVFEVSTDGTLTNTANIDDTSDLRLQRTSSITTARVGEKTFAFVAGRNDNGFSVFEVSTDGTLTNTDNTSDSSELRGVTSIDSTNIGGKTFILVTSQGVNSRHATLRGGISVFELSAAGKLTNRDHINNIRDPATRGFGGELLLDGASAVITARVGSKTFAFVTGIRDHGASVFEVSSSGVLRNTDNIDNDDNVRTLAPGDLKLRGAISVATAQVGVQTLLFVGALTDDGMSVFRVSEDGKLTNILNIADDDTLEIDDTRGIAVTRIGDKTFVFTAGQEDEGVSVFALPAR
jgi:hypothetical protein